MTFTVVAHGTIRVRLRQHSSEESRLMNSSASGSLSTYRASDGAAYERFLGRWSRLLAGPFAEFARSPDDGHVLDVGCGTGSLALVLSERGGGSRVVGIDIATPYIAFARSRQEGAGIDFLVGDASRLPFADRSFAAALAQLSLNFVPDAAMAVREMRRVVKPGGVVAAAVWDFRGGLVYQRLFWDTAAGLDPEAGATRDRLFSGPLALPEGLPRSWREAGLRAVERDSLTIRMEYADFNDYWEPLLGGQGPVGSYVENLQPRHRRQIEERVRAAFLSGAPDGPRSLTATAWAVRGVVP
jgi:SAM-dependent methyltransferase